MPPETPSTPPRRKRGAPLGNKNRFVHGAYARRPEPAPDPEPAPTYPSGRLSLVNEIAILRAYILRTAFVGTITLNLEQTQKLLHTLSLAATSLTRLIQTEAYLSQATGSQVQADNFPWINSYFTELTTSFHASKPESPAAPEDEPADARPRKHAGSSAKRSVRRPPQRSSCSAKASGTSGPPWPKPRPLPVS